jgi:hypothetical protein
LSGKYQDILKISLHNQAAGVASLSVFAQGMEGLETINGWQKDNPGQHGWREVG